VPNLTIFAASLSLSPPEDEMLFIKTLECSSECNVKNSLPEDGIFKMGWEKLAGVLDAPFCKTLSLSLSLAQ
jgi:hypothetical protein